MFVPFNNNQNKIELLQLNIMFFFAIGNTFPLSNAAISLYQHPGRHLQLTELSLWEIQIIEKK